MPAGAAQILMKTSGLLPRDAILAGSGPLLYLIAAQMIDAGVPPKVLLETQTTRMIFKALPHLPKALLGIETLLKGLGLLRKIRTAGVPRYTQTSEFVATAIDNDEISISFKHNGSSKKLKCALLLTHQGVTPSTHISRAAGIAHKWNPDQIAFQPVADQWGQTENPSLHVAGDGAGIGGADAASAAGELAALNLLHICGRLSADARNQRAATSRKVLRRALAIRPFLDVAYAPPAEVLSPPDETIICRCEEVTAGEVRAVVGEGVTGHRQVKTSLRTGMGPCQGRMCDATVMGIIAANSKTELADIAPPRARTPIKPVTLAELSALSSDQEKIE